MNKERLFTHGPLVLFFIIIQIFGLFVLNHYSPISNIVTAENGTNYTYTDYSLPYDLDPPQDVDYKFTLMQLILSLVFVILIILLLMKLHVIKVLRFWFFGVSTIAAAVTLFVFVYGINYGGWIAFGLAFVLSYFKVFRPNIIVHNLTEFLVYPGIAAILVPLFNISTIIALFIVITIYDMYAVWHSGIMQRMAKYQIQKVRVFSGLLLPQFLTSKGIVNPFVSMKDKKSKKKSKKIGVALLGGGDIIFPMLLAGVLMHSGFLGYALGVVIGAALGLFLLILNSEHGKFYPAMPFISLGCLAGSIVVFIIKYLL